MKIMINMKENEKMIRQTEMDGNGVLYYVNCDKYDGQWKDEK